MLRFLPYVLRSLWRHRTRTLLTVSGAAVALFVFGFLEAAHEGLARLTRDARSQRTLVVFQANRFCPGTSRLPERYAETIAEVGGVRSVLPIQVLINNCRASLDLVVFHGLPADRLSARALVLRDGDGDAFRARSDGALVGQVLARRRGLVAGQPFTLGEVTVTVVGTFRAESAAEENVLYAHLAHLQQSRGAQGIGMVTQFEVQLDADADPEAVAREIDARFRDGPVPTDTRTRGAFQMSVVGDLVELVGWARWLGHACVGLVLVLVATTTLMAVQDRVREHAVLQVLGFSDRRIFGLVLAEGVLMGLMGGIAGVGGALTLLWTLGLTVGAEGTTIALVPTPGLAWRGALVSLAVGLLAGAVPAWQAARAEIVRSLREG